MRILITGGAGFLGSHLSDAFIARGDEVFVLDTGSIAKVRHLLEEPRFHYIHDTIFNLQLLDGLAAKVDLIYHMAAVVVSSTTSPIRMKPSTSTSTVLRTY